MAEELNLTGNGQTSAPDGASPVKVVVDTGATENANFGMPTFVSGLARIVNNTYYYENNSLFVSLMPTYMREYALRYVKPCLDWLDGFVKEIHFDAQMGIMSTKIAKSLITGLAKQVVGEKLLFKMNVEQPTEIDRENLKKANKWATENQIIRSVFSGVAWAMASGDALIKLNKTAGGVAWWESFRFDTCSFLTDFCGKVIDATFLIHAYTDTREGKSNIRYCLCEHRFYKTYEQAEIDARSLQVLHKKGDKVAMVEYVVHRTSGQLNNNTNSKELKNGVKWDELPHEIRNAIRNDYSAFRIGEPQQLGFTNIGVEILINANRDLGIPYGNFLGQGLLFEAQSDLITYEYATSCKLRDMYLGKGTLYMPKSMNFNDVANLGMNDSAIQGYGDGKIEFMKGVNPEEQKAIVQQFELRGDQWQNICNNAICNIATKWGMSPKVLSSFLVNGQANMTATQIDSEDDASISFIMLERSYFVEPINRLLETTLNYMGISTNLNVKFSTPSLVNKDRVIARQKELLDSGLTSLEDAIREIYPDLEEEQLQKKVQDAMKKQQEMQDTNNFFKQDNNDFNDTMLDNDLFGKDKQLDGTTNPIQ